MTVMERGGRGERRTQIETETEETDRGDALGRIYVET